MIDYEREVRDLLRLPNADGIRAYARRFGMAEERLAAFFSAAAESYVQTRIYELVQRDYKSGRRAPPPDPTVDDSYAEWRDEQDSLRRRVGALRQKRRSDAAGRRTTVWEWDRNATEWEDLLGPRPGVNAGRRESLYDLTRQVWAFWEDETGQDFRPKFADDEGHTEYYEQNGLTIKDRDNSKPSLPKNDGAEFLLAVFQAMDWRWNGSNCVSALDGITKGRRKRSSAERVRRWRAKNK